MRTCRFSFGGTCGGLVRTLVNRLYPIRATLAVDSTLPAAQTLPRFLNHPFATSVPAGCISPTATQQGIP